MPCNPIHSSPIRALCWSRVESESAKGGHGEHRAGNAVGKAGWNPRAADGWIRRALEEHQVRLTVLACGVCRTDLHLLDGELPQAHYPVTPGHEIVGRVLEVGKSVKEFAVGDRIGVPWLGWTCGVCAYCKQGMENSANEPDSPAARSTEVMPRAPWRMHGTACLSRTNTPMRKPRPVVCWLDRVSRLSRGR